MGRRGEVKLKLRTEIEAPRGTFAISHADRLLMLGSCFTDSVGARLEADGFAVTRNPFGPLYNPLSIAAVLRMIFDGRRYTPSELTIDNAGVSHCLDFASRWQNADADAICAELNDGLDRLAETYREATVVVLTFGSSFGYYVTGDESDWPVGNCHKFPSEYFERRTIAVERITDCWRPLAERIKADGKHLLLTVSPIRHLADGLHGNELSKARLLLACEALADVADYFPSYEIMLDDLRDYRFYAADMKHPSDVAVDYIYQHFANAYFDEHTAAEALRRRAAALRAAHRQIIDRI